MLGWGGVDQATCEVVDSAAELLGVLKRLIKSQDISGDTGAVPVEELGRAGVRNPAVELSEVGGQCTGTGGLGATAWRSQGREVEPQIACYGAGNLFNAEATANELRHLDCPHRCRDEVLVAFEGLRKAADLVVSLRILLPHQFAIPSSSGPATGTHQEIAAVQVEPVRSPATSIE